MLLYYIASKNNQGLFDEICTQKGILIQRHAGQVNLKKLIIEGMTNFSHISYFAVDLDAAKNTDDEILEAFAAFQSMYNARIIVLALSGDKNEKLLKKLVELGVYNNITSQRDLNTKLSECMSELGRQYKSAIVNSCHEVSSESLTVKVGICGTQNRIGTTTQAIVLTKALTTMGEKACYIEANGHDHIKTLSGYYEVEQNERLKKISFGGIDMFYDSFLLPILLTMNYKFYVIDYGVASKESIDEFLGCDIRIICAGAKTWEMTNIVSAIKLLKVEGLSMPGSPANAVTFIFSFVPKVEQAEIVRLMIEHTGRVCFAGFIENMFSNNIDSNICNKIFKDYLPAASSVPKAVIIGNKLFRFKKYFA